MNLPDYKISVILPCYNGSSWIGHSIESVLRQTYGNLELLVIDDGSTDDSFNVITEYASDRRVKIIKKTNGGFASSLNRGIIESTGSLISFIGQDDIWLSHKLATQIEYFKNNLVDVVHSNFHYMDSRENLLGIAKTKMNIYPSKEDALSSLFMTNYIGFETVLVKKDCFSNVGLFDERMVGFCDHDMWMRVVGKFDLGYINSSLVKKRQHNLQLSNTSVDGVFQDELLFVNKNLELYPFLTPLKARKLSSLYYLWGMVLLQQGKNS